MKAEKKKSQTQRRRGIRASVSAFSLHPSALVRRLHHDDRGNMAVLVLLTLIAFITLSGMVWNVGEYAARREQLQATADDAAFAASTWVSRTTNLVDAQNMQICTAASAEAVYDSISVTLNNIDAKLKNEQNEARLLLYGNKQGKPEASVTEQYLGTFPDAEYVAKIKGDPTAISAAETAFNNLLPNYEAAATLIAQHMNQPEQGYFEQEITIAVTENQTDLAALPNVNLPLWISSVLTPKLTTTMQYVSQEQQIASSIRSSVQPGLDAEQPSAMQMQRYTLFGQEYKLAGLVPQMLQQQRDHDITARSANLVIAPTATVDADDQTTSSTTFTAPPSLDTGLGNYSPPSQLDNPPQLPQPPTYGDDAPKVVAPIQTANIPQSQQRLDTVRSEYPSDAMQTFGTLTVTLDPINYSTDANAVWHPGCQVVQSVNVPGAGNMTFSVFVNGSRWGQLTCAPLNRYFWDRFERDRSGLSDEFTPIDNLRTQLASVIHPYPAPLLVAEQGVPRGLPTLPVKTDKPLSDDQVQAIKQVNAAVKAYNAALKAAVAPFMPALQLYSASETLMGWDTPTTNIWNNPLYNSTVDTLLDPTDGLATRDYANPMWTATCLYEGHQVLETMGTGKMFMTVAPYKLYPVPDWAADGLKQSAKQWIHGWIVGHDYNAVFDQVRSQLYAALGSGELTGTGFSDPGAAGSANALAGPITQQLLEQAAETIGTEAGNEWVSRPWPFELTPPTVTVPPTTGVGDADRLEFFSLIAAAAGIDNKTNPHNLFLNGIFKTGTIPTLTIAQAETYNWNEFSQSYGAAERFDQMTTSWHEDWALENLNPNPISDADSSSGVTSIAYYPTTLGWLPWGVEYARPIAGAPTPWRLSTTGGWNYQTRLAHIDGIDGAINQSDTLTALFSKSKIMVSSNQSLLPLINH
jgi:hypothetical protein